MQKHIDELRAALDEMHKTASETSAKQRATKKQQRKYRRTPNFGMGDYVLVGVPEPDKMTGRKLCLRWRGPYRITELMSDYVFEVQNIIDHSKRCVHVYQLIFSLQKKYKT